jgi:hypothetical protein
MVAEIRMIKSNIYDNLLKDRKQEKEEVRVFDVLVCDSLLKDRLNESERGQKNE